MRVPEIMKRKMCFSFEVFPPKADKPLEPLLETLERLYLFNPDFISCTYGAGGTNAGRNIEICRAIKQSKKTIPVTHYTCIGNSREKIRAEMQNYLALGIDHILALRGDFPKGWQGTRGDFNYANELVEFISINFPGFTIAAAGNPEKHFEAPSFESDIAHLRMKQDAGAEFIMTQLCYDVEQYKWWVDKIRKAGVTIPVDVGVMPVLQKEPSIRIRLQRQLNSARLGRTYRQIRR